MENGRIDEAIWRLETVLRSIAGIESLRLTELSSMLTYTKIPKNDFFLKASDDSSRAGFVISGSFRFYYIDFEGTEHTKNFAFENDFLLSYSAFLLQQPSKLYIEALKDSEVFAFDYSNLYKLAETDTRWLKVLLRVSEMSYIQKENRESELLFFDAKTRYLNFCRDYPDLATRLKQYHIASYLGIAPEVLSRIRSNLRNDKY